MKKLKNKKRITPKAQEDHKCQFEYSVSHSSQECTVFICMIPYCDVTITELEDSGTGA